MLAKIKLTCVVWSFFLFVLVGNCQIYQQSYVARPNQPCNPDRDLLLLDNPTASPTAYLRCVPIGISGMGYWSQSFCPSGMNFDFMTQACKFGNPPSPLLITQGNGVRKDGLLNIAILNGSCSSGEQCIGGTVCDANELRCLCPHDTVANLETLSCVSTSQLHEASNQREEESKVSENTRTSRPGESCASGETCTGGSFCMRAVGLCLCPNELESYNGQCVHPKFAKTRMPKVPLGAACGNMVICDNGSSCFNGLCQCISPSVEHQGRCVEYVLQRKQVGPGELCNRGEVCVKGSVCDPKIPVCVCPPGTDLDNGVCTQVRTSFAGLNTFYTKPTSKVFPEQSFSKYGPMVPHQIHSNEKTIIIYPTLTANQYPHQPYTMNQHHSTNQLHPASPRPEGPLHLSPSKKLEVGSPCSLNADCGSNAYCDGSRQPPACKCLATHIGIDGKCEKILLPGQIGCFDDRQCDAAYPLARCLNRSCVCPIGTKIVEQSCVPGSICSLTDSQRRCPPGSICIDSECQCTRPLIAFEGRCLSRSELYLPDNVTLKCSTDNECPLEFECGRESQECRCPEGTYRLASRCISLHSTYATRNTNQIGMEDPRSNEKEPLDIEAALLSKETAESLEKIFNVLMKLNLAGDLNDSQNDSSVSDVQLETEINENQQIAEDIQSNNNHMINLDNEEDNSIDLPQSREITRQKRMNPELSINESCLSSEECSNGTVCTNSKCECPRGFYLKNKVCHRVEYRPLNSQCIASVNHCSGGGACRRGLCVCVDGAVESQRRCRQKIGGQCKHNEHCASGSRCMAATLRCECPPGRQLTSNQSCIVKVAHPGDSCINAELCTASFCKNGVCSCLENRFILRGRRCIKIDDFKTLDVLSQQNTFGLTSTTTTRSIIRPGGSADMHKVVLSVVTRKTNETKGQIDKDLNQVQQQTESYARPPRPHHQYTKQRKSLMNTLISTAKPGEMCLDGEACTGGSICRDGMCACSDDEVIIGDKCVTSEGEALQTLERISKSAPGQLCTEDTTCTGNSICLSNICTCVDGSTLFRGECLRKGTDTDLKTIYSQAILFNPRALDNLMDASALKVIPRGYTGWSEIVITSSFQTTSLSTFLSNFFAIGLLPRHSKRQGKSAI